MRVNRHAGIINNNKDHNKGLIRIFRQLISLPSNNRTFIRHKSNIFAKLPSHLQCLVGRLTRPSRQVSRRANRCYRHSNHSRTDSLSSSRYFLLTIALAHLEMTLLPCFLTCRYVHETGAIHINMYNCKQGTILLALSFTTYHHKPCILFSVCYLLFTAYHAGQ